MMQIAQQRSGHIPYSMFVATGIFLLAVTAYPKPLHEGTSCKEKPVPANTQCVVPAAKNMTAPLR
jgi:hypothetical protein